MSNVTDFSTSAKLLKTKEEELLKTRLEELEQLLTELKDSCLGLYQNITPLIVTNNNEISVDKIEQLSEKLSNLAAKRDNSLKPLYKSFCTVLVAFLFSECNYEDRVWISFFKIANTFITNEESEFTNTTFGIMCEDSKEDKYPLNNTAYKILQETIPELEKLYNELYEKHNFSKDIQYAVEEYLKASRQNLLCSNESYNKVIHKLKSTISHVQKLNW